MKEILYLLLALVLPLICFSELSDNQIKQAKAIYDT